MLTKFYSSHILGNLFILFKFKIFCTFKFRQKAKHSLKLKVNSHKKMCSLNKILLCIFLCLLLAVSTADSKRKIPIDGDYSPYYEQDLHNRYPQTRQVPLTDGVCPNGRFEEKHTLPEGVSGNQQAITFTAERRGMETQWNHVIEYTDSWRRTLSGNCRNTVKVPLYLVRTNPLGIRTVRKLGNQCSVSHDPVTGHILWWTWSCLTDRNGVPL